MKVPCKVIVSVKPRISKGPRPPRRPPRGARAVLVGDSPFDVEPKEVVIPPHEHRYVSCFFKPGNMMIE